MWNYKLTLKFRAKITEQFVTYDKVLNASPNPHKFTVNCSIVFLFEWLLICEAYLLVVEGGGGCIAEKNTRK